MAPRDAATLATGTRPRFCLVVALAIAIALTAAACDVPSASLAPDPAGSTADASADPASTGPSTPRPPVATDASPSSGPVDGEVDIARLGAGETPSDWVEILSSDGTCRQAVPPTWIESGLPGQVLSPEILASSLVAGALISTWPDHVASLQATYFTDGQDVLVETDDVFLLRSTRRGGASHVLALNGGATTCGIVLAIGEAGIEDYAEIGLQILYTLAEVG